MNELHQKNFERIYRINWVLCGPFLLMFGWPYYMVASLFCPDIAALTGALFFSIPFTLTILHGHISVAIGTLHRDQYYSWQARRNRLFRVSFHPVLFTTRFRLILLLISLLIMGLGWLT
jgi:hypothetical protein